MVEVDQPTLGEVIDATGQQFRMITAVAVTEQPDHSAPIVEVLHGLAALPAIAIRRYLRIAIVAIAFIGVGRAVLTDYALHVSTPLFYFLGL